MSSSRTTPLFIDRQRDSIDSTTSSFAANYANAANDYANEETSLLHGLATTSPLRPFSTTFHPTILLRSTSLLLALPSFILFLSYHPHNGSAITSSIVFLSFAIARQVQLVLLSHFGSQLVVIRVEVVHHRLKSVERAAEQEKWIWKVVNAFVDGVILLGLLISLAVVAAGLKTCRFNYQHGYLYKPSCKLLEAAVILGFLSFGALLLSILDFGRPSLVTMAISVERPVNGILKLATSVLYGEEEEETEEDNTKVLQTDDHHRQRRAAATRNSHESDDLV